MNPRGQPERELPGSAPVPVPPTWTTATTASIHTGSWRSALPRHVQAPSPCHQACPVDGDIATWIGRARDGDVLGAWEALVRHNPFPAITGRVCHHPCEQACNRAGYDEALAICSLERFVGDVALAQQWSFPRPAVSHEASVAVVGGGPAGLSAAYQLRRLGWRVTVLEASDALGGLLRHGIPAYRLPRDVLDGEIARIERLGVTVRLRTPLATADDWAAVRAAHDAVFVATGAQVPKRLPGLDYTRPWVADGATWLARANAGQPPSLGRRLIVVGGGSAALDVARSARRRGHDVTLLALEARAQMPAQREEVEEALEEGVVLLDGAMLTSAIEEGSAVRLEAVRVRFVPGERRGTFSVERVPGSAFALQADAIVTSIGQDPDAGALPPGSVVDDALLVADGITQATAADGVWAGGDVASRARYVTQAIGEGKRAAWAIDHALRLRLGIPARPGGWQAGPPAATARDTPVPLSAVATHSYPHAPRAVPPRRDAALRLASADEVQGPLAAPQALAEAARCFSCGTCIACDTCVIVCPDLAVVRGADGYRVLGDYCKGCGLCVKECPTGAMDMIEEAR